jgi:pimeloyl-ACP methyl ester carboxylesterase
MRRRLLVLLCLAAAPAAVPARASALAFTPCNGEAGFDCATLRVPLDRSGRIPGTLGLRIAAQDTAGEAPRAGVLVALSGGPGQSSVSVAPDFAQTLQPLLRRYRLVVLDQRGTGASGALRCPALQRLGALDPVAPPAYADCAQRLGPSRAAFSTADTVEDLEALRVALGAPKLALMGVSYGTYVAEQYARTHPASTDRLLLDSVIAPGGVDAFLLDTYSRLPRVLREQCARRACDQATPDPVADVGLLAERLASGRPIGGLKTSDELLNLLIAGDLNPFLQPALPAALHAAVRGDTAPMARLRRIGEGGPTKLADLSAGLNAATSCDDARLPYALTDPPPERETATRAALSAIAPTRYAPFGAGTVLRTSYAEDCLDWPPDVSAAPSTAPLPAVPTLLLSGRLDLRTPLENAEAVQAAIPGAQRVTVAGTGHDELDSDTTGCVQLALRRWAAGRAVRTPCVGHTNAVAPFPAPPSGLAAYRSAPGVGGQRGREVFATLDAVADARVAGLQALFGGLAPRGPGLRGGRYSQAGTVLRLRRWSYAPGVRVTGTLSLRGLEPAGRLRVDGPGHLDGTLRLGATGRVAGTLAGRGVRYRPRTRARTAAEARGGALLAAVLARAPAALRDPGRGGRPEGWSGWAGPRPVRRPARP